MSAKQRLSLLATATSVVGPGMAAAAPAAHATATGPTINFTIFDADANGDSVLQEQYSPRSTAASYRWSENFSVNASTTPISVTTDCGTGAGPQPVPVGGPMMGVTGVINCGFDGWGSWSVSVSATDGSGTSTVTHHVIVKAPIVPPPPPVIRFDGDTRYGTAVAVSQAAFPNPGSAGAVVLARGDVFADALAGIPLTKAKNGPLLLTPGGVGVTSLPAGVEAELIRVLPQDKSHTVFILGGIGAVSQAVEDHIAALGYSTVRLAGVSRFDTALAIATDPRALNDPQTTVVARGDDFADALAAGPFAANKYQDAQGRPAAVVLTQGTGDTAMVPAATGSYLAGKLAASQKVIAIGGGAAKAVGGLPGAAGHYDQLVGSDRYATANEVGARGWPGANPTQPIGVVAGSSFADALTGGAYLALKNGPLLLTETGDLSTGVTLAVTARLGIQESEVDVFGGPKVIVPDHIYMILGLLNEGNSAYSEHHAAF
jgi:putative cell wall-binding protein